MSQKVVVTAAASGVGLAVARPFAAVRAKVFISDLNRQVLEAARKAGPAPVTILRLFQAHRHRSNGPWPCKLQRPRCTCQKWAYLGPSGAGRAEDPEKCESEMTVDLTGTFNVTRLAIRHMSDRWQHAHLGKLKLDRVRTVSGSEQRGAGGLDRLR
jgi:NAD(P)-dependent dehydrogenase (short-subunit alcohol dehydrogenase family)